MRCMWTILEQATITRSLARSSPGRHVSNMKETIRNSPKLCEIVSQEQDLNPRPFAQ